ncbi:MAG: hypothetical protein U9N77_13760 [Thermodesulfobacteriota bacterium]|nr:hypothetical protein [Thermodesulfobacteriota bacterium]
MTKSVNTTQKNSVLAATVVMGTAGAVTGGVIAAAKNICEVKQNNIKTNQAVNNVFKESAGTGIAMATATAVITPIGIRNPIIGILGFTCVATGTKYLWNSMVSSEKSIPQEQQTVLAEKSAKIEEEKREQETEQTPDTSAKKNAQPEKTAAESEIKTTMSQKSEDSESDTKTTISQKSDVPESGTKAAKYKKSNASEKKDK